MLFVVASSVGFENSNYEVDFSNVLNVDLKLLLSQLSQFVYESK